MQDLIIRNGHLLDLAVGLDQVGDIAVENGRISRIGSLEKEKAGQEIDAQGCYVTPGLIDYHAHVCYGISDFSMPADLACLPSGVTGVVDGGSAGSSNFEAFYRHIISDSVVDIKAFLHVSNVGQPTHDYPEEMNPDRFNKHRILELCHRYPDTIIGLKLRQSAEIAGKYGLDPLRKALLIAEEAGLRLSVHSSNPPGEATGILELLRPGDIFCHVFHQEGSTILDDKGKILPAVWKARERGVLFDMAHGSMQFSGLVARRAIAEGFLPDIVSSDLSLLSLYRQPTHSFVYILSELLNLGMDFRQIITRCTETPGRLANPDFTGFMHQGAPADLAILRVMNHEVRYKDRYDNEYMGNRLIKPEATIKNGVVMFRQYDFL